MNTGFQVGRFYRTPLVFAVYLAVAVIFQWTGGAYTSELGEHADEAAHYVTGLMVRDYIVSLASLQFRSPLEYAKDYYEHYPKVALGHWPPGFYMLQAAWTLLFSSDRASVMLLLAVVAAVLGALVFCVARTEFSTPIAVTAGLMVVADPLVQAYSRQVMSDLVIATMVFGGLVCYSKYLDTNRDCLSIAFGFIAAVAVLTKGTGFILAGVPPIGMFVTRRFRLLGNWSFWLAAVIVVILAGPWYYLAPGARDETALPTLMRADPELGPLWVFAFKSVAGTAVLPFFVIGLIVCLVSPLLRREHIGGVWAVSASSIVSMLAMLAIADHSRSPRHLIVILPPVLLFAVAGVVWVLSLKPFQILSTRWMTAFAVLILVALFLSNYRHLRFKEYTGFRPIAEQIISNRQFSKSAVLVSSDASGEGMLISEVAAMDTERPSHMVIRGTKVISRANWFGRKAVLLYKTPKELSSFLAQVAIGVIVFDTDPPRRPPHHTVVEQMLKLDSQQWKLLATFPQHRGQGDIRGGIKIYRLLGSDESPMKEIPSQLQGQGFSRCSISTGDVETPNSAGCSLAILSDSFTGNLREQKGPWTCWNRLRH